MWKDFLWYSGCEAGSILWGQVSSWEYTVLYDEYFNTAATEQVGFQLAAPQWRRTRFISWWRAQIHTNQCAKYSNTQLWSSTLCDVTAQDTYMSSQVLPSSLPPLDMEWLMQSLKHAGKDLTCQMHSVKQSLVGGCVVRNSVCVCPQARGQMSAAGLLLSLSFKIQWCLVGSDTLLTATSTSITVSNGAACLPGLVTCW